MNTSRTIAEAPGKPGMSADRKAAVWIGLLYLIGMVGMVVSVVVTNEVLSGPAHLAQVAAEPNRVALGALLMLVAGLSLALVPVVFWPIGRRYNETLAMGYVVFRGALETIFYVITALLWLLLIALSKQPDGGPLAGFVGDLTRFPSGRHFASYLYRARGSTREIRAQLRIAIDRARLTDQESATLAGRFEEVA